MLPNSSNVFMAAERAAELSEKRVHVVPSRSQQAGPGRGDRVRPRPRRRRQRRRADATRSSASAPAPSHPAARDDAGGRFRAGEAVGFVGDELVAWGEPADTLRSILATLADDAELVTCLSGDGAPLGDAEITALHDGSPAELELTQGGQPAYWWLLSAE